MTYYGDRKVGSSPDPTINIMTTLLITAHLNSKDGRAAEQDSGGKRK